MHSRGWPLPAHVVVSDNGKIYHDTTTNWGPRLGLAYRLTSTTAIRAGFGIFYDNWAAVHRRRRTMKVRGRTSGSSWPTT